jgi:hypothetical protein
MFVSVKAMDGNNPFQCNEVLYFLKRLVIILIKNFYEPLRNPKMKYFVHMTVPIDSIQNK